MIFLGEIVSYLVYLGQGEDFKLTTKLSEKVQYPHNQAIQNDLKYIDLATAKSEAPIDKFIT